MSSNHRRFLVAGHVQGVGFRYATIRQARQHGLCGWVRNLGDGRVEVEAHGDQESLAKLEKWLWQGPAHATVTDVASSDTEAADYPDFEGRG